MCDCPSDPTPALVQTEEEKAVKVGFGRLLNMNRREWPYLAVGVLASAAVGTVMPLFAILLSDLIAGLTDINTPPSEILRYAFFFWGLGVGNFVCMTIQVCLPAAPSSLLPCLCLWGDCLPARASTVLVCAHRNAPTA